MSGMADQIIPGFTAFHPLGARLAQECARITASEFRSMMFQTQYDVPAYEEWLLHEADPAPLYRWHRIYLQHLQSEHAADRWLIKSPAHLWHLGALMAEYPDAVVIQTHRDPLKVITSISALVAHLRRMASDHSSVARAAAQYSEDIFVGLERSLVARTDGTLPAGQVIDVQFAEFMADPFATIGAVYDQLGLPLTARPSRGCASSWPPIRGTGAAVGTRYTWADTGLDERALRERAAPYQEYFGVPSEALA